ncbi:hypothetical protein OAE37_00025 [Pirellulaceae bacterium]|nr:hypothetical protein [Pirellulaceae bacterium]
MKTFPDPPSAFDYVQSCIRTKGRGFLVNVVGPKDEINGYAATLQVLDENQIFQNGLFGFVIYLAFDTEPETQESFELFKRYPRSVEFESIPTDDGIPCFALRFGKDVTALLDILSEVLQFVFGYPMLTAFKCDVYEC